jgi:hypothetical protein
MLQKNRNTVPGGVILLCELGEDIDEVVVEIRELERTQMASISSVQFRKSIYRSKTG